MSLPHDHLEPGAARPADRHHAGPSRRGVPRSEAVHSPASPTDDEDGRVDEPWTEAHDGRSPWPASEPRDWEAAPPRTALLRWRPAGLAIALVAVTAAVFWAVQWLTSPAPPPTAAMAAEHSETASPPGGTSSTPPSPATVAPTDVATASGPGESLRVHVVGSVHRPGLVTVPAGSRVADAVEAAGGATSKARTQRINLAAPVADGQQVLVPDGRTPDASLAPASTAGAGEAPPAPGSAAGGADSSGTGAVDLNTADAQALQTLPGVGPAMAERILSHRETVGPFTGLQDLDAVSGVGPATLERLKDRVTW